MLSHDLVPFPNSSYFLVILLGKFPALYLPIALAALLKPDHPLQALVVKSFEDNWKTREQRKSKSAGGGQDSGLVKFHRLEVKSSYSLKLSPTTEEQGTNLASWVTSNDFVKDEGATSRVVLVLRPQLLETTLAYMLPGVPASILDDGQARFERTDTWLQNIAAEFDRAIPDGMILCFGPTGEATRSMWEKLGFHRQAVLAHVHVKPSGSGATDVLEVSLYTTNPRASAMCMSGKLSGAPKNIWASLDGNFFYLCKMDQVSYSITLICLLLTHTLVALQKKHVSYLSLSQLFLTYSLVTISSFHSND